MSAPADGYTILEHIDDAASAYAAGQSEVHPAKDLIPLVTAQITFNQIYMRSDEKRFSDWKSFVAYAKKLNAEGKKPTIANVARRGSMERVVLQLTLEPFGIELRSEEHKSELQSLMRSSYAVFCLKKKKHRGKS